MHGTRLLPVHGAQTISAGIAPTNDHHPFVGGQDVRACLKSVPLAAPVLLRQKLHGKVNATQFAARNFQIAGLLGAAG